MPAGTGNDFARGAGLTADPRQLINNLLRDPEPEQVDCGFFTSNIKQIPKGYFVNNFGIGFDAFVVHQSNHEQLKKTPQSPQFWKYDLWPKYNQGTN